MIKMLPLWTLMLRGPAGVMVLGDSPADATGVSNALQGLARLFAGMVVGVASLALVICGLLYMTAFDDVSRAMHARRAIGAIVIGLLLVVLATTIAPQLISAIQPPTSH